MGRSEPPGSSVQKGLDKLLFEERGGGRGDKKPGRQGDKEKQVEAQKSKKKGSQGGRRD